MKSKFIEGLQHSFCSIAALIFFGTLSVNSITPPQTSDFPRASSSVSILQTSTPILDSIPFETSFTDSIHLILCPRFISPSTICFCDIRDHRVLIVEGDSGAVQVIGREGAGPGEFRAPSSIAVWDGNGLVVYDTMLLRLLLFDESGEFQRMLIGQYSARMGMPEMVSIDESSFAISPRMMSADNVITDHVVLIPSSFDTTLCFPAPEPISFLDADNPIGMDISNTTLGSGENGTILVAYHTNYSIRRYSKAGDLIWDSGSLDRSFRPPSINIPRREGYAVTTSVYNGIENITEIAGFGFALAVWAYEGDGLGSMPPWYVDLRRLNGELIVRIPVPDHLQLGDIYRDGQTLYILAYHLGQMELPTIRIFSIDLNKISASS